MCRKCTSRKWRFGVPTGVTLPRAYYAHEWALATKFARHFRDHPAVIEAHAYLTAWIVGAREGKPVPGHKAVARLADRGGTAEIALVELLAVALYERLHVGALTITPYMYAIAFLKSYKGMPRGPQAKPHGSPPPPPPPQASRKEREAIAKELRKLNPLFANALAWFDAQEKLRNAQIQGMSETFPVLCERCTYNERKAKEKRDARRKQPGVSYVPRNPTGRNGTSTGNHPKKYRTAVGKETHGKTALNQAEG
jgi:hypothetical protein